MQDYGYNVGTDYQLTRNNATDISVIPFFLHDGPQIQPYVTEIGWNDQWVFAKQYGLKKDTRYLLD
jgi:hypothetical protein